MMPPGVTHPYDWLDPGQAAEAIVRQAINACVEGMPENSLEVALDRLQQHDPATWCRWQYAVAEQVGQYLETCADDVKAVYIYGDDRTPEDRRGEEATLAPLIHLIVWAQPSTAALVGLIDILNQALALQLRTMVGTFGVSQLLDVQMVDDQDVSRHSGHAALLGSSRYRSAQVWRRERAST